MHWCFKMHFFVRDFYFSHPKSCFPDFTDRPLYWVLYFVKICRFAIQNSFSPKLIPALHKLPSQTSVLSPNCQWHQLLSGKPLFVFSQASQSQEWKKSLCIPWSHHVNSAALGKSQAADSGSNLNSKMLFFTGQPEWRSFQKKILPDNAQQRLAGQGIEHIQGDLSSLPLHRAVKARSGWNSSLV